MSASLLTQLLVSFLAGGLTITFLSLIAEKADEKIAGIIMMFPSTIVLGFFFLGLTTSPGHVAEVVPATLVPIGMITFSAMVYIYFSQLYASYLSSKFLQILFSITTTSIIWLMLATPFAIFKFRQVTLGLIGYFVFMGLAHYYMNRQRDTVRLPRVAYTRLQLLFRASFVGTIIAGVVFLGKTLNPFWGGVFTMYPAATFASLIIFHFHYEPSQLVFFMKKAPLGSLSILVYAFGAMLLFPMLGLVWGTILAYAICFVFSILLIRYQQKKS